MSNSHTFKAFLLGSGKSLVTLTGLVSTAVLARILTKIDFAAYKQTFLAYNFVAPFLSMGLPMALYYFLPIDREHSRSILTGNVSLLFFMGFLFLGFVWCGGNDLIAKRFNNPVLCKLLLIFSLYAIFVLPVRAIDACLISFNKVKTLTIFNVASRLVVFLFMIGLALILRSSYGPVIGAVAAEFFLFFPAIFLMYRATCGKGWLPNKKNMWEQIKYSVPLGISSSIGSVSVNLDKVLVSSLCTPENFAVYVNGAIEIPLIGAITGSVMSILIPEFVEMYKRKEYREILSLWHRAMLKSALLIFPIMIFLIAMAPEVMRVLFSPRYIDSIVPFRIYLLKLPLRITTFGSIIMAAGKNILIIYCSIVSLSVNFILSIIMIRLFNYNGAAIATVIELYLVSVPLYLFFIRSILNEGLSHIIPYQMLANIFLISVLGSIVIFIPKSLDLSDLIRLILSSCLYALAMAFLYYKKNWILVNKRKIGISI